MVFGVSLLFSSSIRHGNYMFFDRRTKFPADSVVSPSFSLEKVKDYHENENKSTIMLLNKTKYNH